MTSRRIRAFLSSVVAVWALTSVGCTWICVSSVADDASAAGIRYSLPKPFVQVVPNGDGSVEVEVVYLPDSKREYAIHSGSFLASHQLETLVERGMLQKLAWSAKETAVAADLVRASGEIVQSALSQEAAEKQAARTAIQTAENGLRTAEADLSVAQARLDVLLADEGATADQIRTARLMVAERQSLRDAAREALAAARRQTPTATVPEISFSPGTGTLAINRPGAPTPAAAERAYTISGGKLAKMVAGPVLFAIDESIHGGLSTVRLRPVKTVITERTSGKTADEETQRVYQTTSPASVPAPTLSPKGVQVARLNDAKQLVVVYTSSKEIHELKNIEAKRLSDGTTWKPPVTVDGTAVTVFVDSLPDGEYEIEIDFTYELVPGTHESGEWRARFAKGSSKAPTLLPRGVIGVVPDKDGKASLILTIAAPVLEVKSNEITVRVIDGSPVDHVPPVALTTATQLTVTLTRQPSGEYELTVPFRFGKPPQDSVWRIRYRILK